GASGREELGLPAGRGADPDGSVVPLPRIFDAPALRIDVAEEEERSLDVVRRHPAVEADLVLAAAGLQQSVESVEEGEHVLILRIRAGDEAGDAEDVERIEEVIDLGRGRELFEGALDRV